MNIGVLLVMILDQLQSQVAVKLIVWIYRYHHYLQRNGLIDLDVDGVWMTTEKAEVLIKYWCETPLPVAVWKIPGREENQE